MRKLLRGFFISLLSLLAFDQALQFLVLRGPDLAGRPIAPFDPPLFHEGQRRSVARIKTRIENGAERFADVHFDPLLGWCSEPGFAGSLMQYDWAGCRIAHEETLREKDPSRKRIVLIGGSFTRGDEVEPHESWAALLGEREGDPEFCNLGMGAFGVDQALLRYERDGKPLEPDEVWLGLMPQASLRCVSVYRPALRHWSNAVAFKPRFLLRDNGALSRFANPAHSLEHVLSLVSDQVALLDALGGSDFWIERVPAAYLPRGSHWSHHFASTRIVLTLMERGKRSAHEWMDDPGSEPSRVLRAVLEEARRIVNGPRLRIVVLPGRSDMLAPSRWWRDMLPEIFEENNIFDLTADLPRDFGTNDANWAASGHYSPEGNRVVAELLRGRRK